MKYLFIILAFTFSSCNWAKQKTKETVNKTGEVVAKTGSEFVNGVSKGNQNFHAIHLSDSNAGVSLRTTSEE